MCLRKHCYCRWWGVTSPICNNTNKGYEIYQMFHETGESADCSQIERGDKGHQGSMGMDS